MRADSAQAGLSLADLTREFGRRFSFGAARMGTHKAFTAERHRDEPGPGLHTVITPDLAEMARALRADRDALDDTG